MDWSELFLLSLVWRLRARAYQEEAAWGSLLRADFSYRCSVKEVASYRPQHVLSCWPGAHQPRQDQILTGTLKCLKPLFEQIHSECRLNLSLFPRRETQMKRWGSSCTTICICKARWVDIYNRYKYSLCKNNNSRVQANTDTCEEVSHWHSPTPALKITNRIYDDSFPTPLPPIGRSKYVGDMFQ